MMEEPLLKVGILSGNDIGFTLEGTFGSDGGESLPAGTFRAVPDAGGVAIRGEHRSFRVSHAFSLHPVSPDATFVVHGVTIGLRFHWEQKRDQRHAGAFTLLPSDGTLLLINTVPLEDYLKSVISSEMSASGPPDFLKAHAITSRSWLIAQLKNSRRLGKKNRRETAMSDDDVERIRWYDREEHQHFDVCADDHCQRFQGITRAHHPAVVEAVRATRGIVLTEQGEVCDARFSKACGGMTEAFENVWEPVHHRYLSPVPDSPGGGAGGGNLTREEAASAWIRGRPPAFCNTTDASIVAHVLVDYDQGTVDFYRWKAEYGQDELAEIVRNKSGIDFGRIVELIPMERGASGRLVRLKIVGTKTSRVIGKELEIRRTLSRSHLYSAAFVVDAYDRSDGVPGRFVVSGAGWGHGVGLCQIGAAVMGGQGYGFGAILAHYFSGAVLSKAY